MAVTINVNGLSLCHKGSGGVTTATLPDVCKSPGAPVPYPNIAFSSDLVGGTTTIVADGGNMCANYGSQFSKSIGDEPGVGGGVASGTFMKEATWITYSFDVKLEGKGACRLTDKMFQNHQNTVDALGELQPALTAFEKLICPIICKIAERIKKGEKLPNGKSTWTQVINDELKPFASELEKLGVRMEKSVVVAAAKGAAEAWGRKALTRFGVEQLAKKGVVAAIPVIGEVIGTLWLAYDIGSTVVELGQAAMEAYDVMRFRPDFTISAGGENLYGDIKLEATGDAMREGQQEALDALNGKKKTPVLSETSCGCNKPSV
jgi:hypothetical protein